MFPYLGLKASTDQRQIDERLQYHPQVFEFFTTADDVTPARLVHLRKMIQHVQATGIEKIVIHHPMKFGATHNEVSVNPKNHPEQYAFMMQSSQELIDLAISTDTQLLIHGAYNSPVTAILADYPSIAAARDAVFKRLDHFRDLGGDHVMFENSISPLFNYGDEAIEDRIIDHRYRLCFDTSHAFIVLHGDNAGLQRSMAQLKSQVVHYHFVDSMGQFHDSLQLGTGAIDWAPLKPLCNQAASNIFEINLKDQFDSREMRASYQYLKRSWHLG